MPNENPPLETESTGNIFEQAQQRYLKGNTNPGVTSNPMPLNNDFRLSMLNNNMRMVNPKYEPGGEVPCISCF